MFSNSSCRTAMLAAALGLAYLGVACCYAASPSADARVWGVAVARSQPHRARGAGLALLMGALAIFAAWLPVAVGLLVGSAAAVLAASFVVIAAPLVPRLVPAPALLAAFAVLLTPWL